MQQKTIRGPRTLQPLIVLCFVAALTMTACSVPSNDGSLPPESDRATVQPGEPVTLAVGDGTLKLLIPDGPGAAQVEVTLSELPEGMPLREGEVALSRTYRISHDWPRSVPVSSEGAPHARLSVRFDPAELPPGAQADELRVVAKARYLPDDHAHLTVPPEEVPEVEHVTTHLLGFVDAGEFEPLSAGSRFDLELHALYRELELMVIYHPRLRIAERLWDAVLPLCEPAWQTNRVLAVFDASDERLRQIVLESVGNDSAEAVAQFVEARVADVGARAARYYQARSFRERASDLEGEGDLKAYLKAYHQALGDALEAATDGEASVHDAYANFIRNRFYEHDDASLLRKNDDDMAYTARLDRFEEHAQAKIAISADGSYLVDAELLPAFGALPPMASAVLKLAALEGYQGELELHFELSSGTLAADAARINVYPKGAAGSELELLHYVDSDFGRTHGALYVLVINTSLEDALALTVRAEARSQLLPEAIPASNDEVRLHEAR
jgi:hypothetical protein